MVPNCLPNDNAGPSCAQQVGLAGHATVASWLRLLVAPGQVAELRAIRHDKGIAAGFYGHEHLEKMARDGLGLSSSGQFKGIYFTFNPVSASLVHRSPNAVREIGRGATKDSEILFRRWLLIDVDPQRPGTCSATEQEKAKAHGTITRVRDYLREQGWPEPVLADSGNGYHLLYQIDLPADDGGLVKAVLGTLAERFDGEGAEVDRTVFNPSRITKLYGTKACKGEDTAERPHRWTKIIEIPGELKMVPRELLETLAGQSTAKPSPKVAGRDGVGGVGPAPDMATNRNQELARAYITKIPNAVEGQGGDKRTFTVACYLAKDFDLTVEDALPLLLEYNQRCQPPWTEEELRRKLEHASREQGERGRLLRAPANGRPNVREQPARPPAPVPGGHPFLGVVPDFIMWDADLARPTPPSPRKDSHGRLNKRHIVSRDWIVDITRHALIAQRRLPILVPDVFVAQLIWGPREAGRWPRNWRRTIQSRCRPRQEHKPEDKGLSKQEKARRTREANRGRQQLDCRACSAPCPFSGLASVPHLHFRWMPPDEVLGVMNQFVCGKTPEGLPIFDFRNSLTPEEVEERKAALKKEIKARRSYLPEYIRNNPEQSDEAKAELRQMTGESEPGKNYLNDWHKNCPLWLYEPTGYLGSCTAQVRTLAALDERTHAPPLGGL